VVDSDGETDRQRLRYCMSTLPSSVCAHSRSSHGPEGTSSLKEKQKDGKKRIDTGDSRERTQAFEQGRRVRESGEGGGGEEQRR
jgi:hypothetical protein